MSRPSKTRLSKTRQDSTMFELLKDQPPDALLQLIKLHRDDPRADKVDLGVGV